MTNNSLPDVDPVETQEWLEAFSSVLEREGAARVHYLITKLIDKAKRAGVNLPYPAITAYLNTIRAEDEPPYPGNVTLEERLLAYIRWNAMAMVVRGGKRSSDLGGHIASFASAAMLYEVGFNHFFKGASANNPGDLLYIQGHSSPGIYARALLEGRLTLDQLDHFREEVEVDGLSSYPHPWLMPDFWQFATVSMGLGPLQGIYQARFLKYLQNRELQKTDGRKVWVFCGDGEMDEPESLGAITLAGREHLDNLVFVINCNLQRLDGPVRGNAKIIQELEGVFHGAGWNVIKVIWDHHWDPLFARDKNGALQDLVTHAVDGEYQNFKAKDGAYGRENFFGKDPAVKAMVDHLSDHEIEHLEFGGHDLRKIYAAYHAAINHKGQPTIILAKTIKGYGMGKIGQGQNTTHQQKKLNEDEVKYFRDRFNIPVADDKVAEVPYCVPAANSPEIAYLQERRAALNGFLPARYHEKNLALEVPPLEAFATFTHDSGDREFSTTMVFVRILNMLLKDKVLKDRIVPIVPDESRTFGMEGLFRQFGIYSHVGQLYKPVDSEQLMFYREDKKGQILEEGITEPGAFSSWMAAATSYSTNQFPMIPFFIYYSMFGFQRVGDLAWAAGDMRARGFLLGATAGRTTLAGEGLQHQDGHSLIMSGLIPNCVSYDPTYSYELAVIIQDGLRRMFAEQEDVYYYITLMNENYPHHAMPDGAREGIIKGMYLLKAGDPSAKIRMQLLGSGTILREVLQAAAWLQQDYGVSADIWSVTSFGELGREANAIERWNLLHPEATAKTSYVYDCLADKAGPILAATDYVRAYSDQIRGHIGNKAYSVLGTDGFGRSDTREQLRHFFEVDAKFIVVASLKILADEKAIPYKMVAAAIKKFGIDPEKPNPLTV